MSDDTGKVFADLESAINMPARQIEA